MCSRCLKKVEESAKIIKRLRDSEEFYFAIWRGDYDVDRDDGTTETKREEKKDLVILKVKEPRIKQPKEDDDQRTGAKTKSQNAGEGTSRERKDPRKELKCEHCQKEFRDRYRLNIHLTTHSTIRAFRCDVDGCNKFFSAKPNLNTHMKIYHSKTKCSECSMVFPSISTLRQHVLKIHSAEFQCDLCSFVTKCQSDFIAHFHNMHIDFKPTLPKPAVLTRFHCQICYKKLSEKTKMRRHIETVHEKKTRYNCDQCTMKFYQVKDMRTHKMMVHTFVNDDTTNANRPFKCDQEGCNMYFKDKGILQRHRKVLHNLDPSTLNLQISLHRSSIT
jgi:uncharacterized Zn-finger protein